MVFSTARDTYGYCTEGGRVPKGGSRRAKHYLTCPTCCTDKDLLQDFWIFSMAVATYLCWAEGGRGDTCRAKDYLPRPACTKHRDLFSHQDTYLRQVWRGDHGTKQHVKRPRSLREASRCESQKTQQGAHYWSQRCRKRTASVWRSVGVFGCEHMMTSRVVRQAEWPPLLPLISIAFLVFAAPAEKNTLI